MKIYIVMAFSAEPWSNDDWVDSVWESKSAAEQYIKDNPGKIGLASGAERFSTDYGPSYILSQHIVEKELRRVS